MMYWLKSFEINALCAKSLIPFQLGSRSWRKNVIFFFILFLEKGYFRVFYENCLKARGFWESISILLKSMQKGRNFRYEILC